MDHYLASLPPGFRFQPNDLELHYYLKNWVSGNPLKPIDVVDVYKSEPWDLTRKSTLKMGDQESYFFSALGRKYGKSPRFNRTTEKGFWKSTGKDRKVRHNSRTVMMKKILTFYTGRPGHGVPTPWVMHEYRLVDKELEKNGIALDSLVLCKISQKSRTGPKNEEASFGEEAATEEVAVGDGETSELHHDQNFIPEENGMDANSVRDDGFYIEANDLLNPMEENPADFEMADQYLNLDYDLPDMNFEGFDPSEFLGTENASSHQTPITQKNEIGEADQLSKESLRLSKLQGSNDASSSKHNPKALTDESEVTLPGNLSESEINRLLVQTLGNSM
ncbi:NAC domain-containing protein 78-like isoform X2 [Corylus avellana]|uniref:NAC domain-containing protein 78-like isoform X2 n=1 Tax=Corylus avellana TaxID=13451 RepID=UPI00286D40EF|nr:NAC domain-containing protein 78-like isoform X2 [Corylus avellana]